MSVCFWFHAGHAAMLVYYLTGKDLDIELLLVRIANK